MNMLLSTVQNVKVSRKKRGGNSVNAAVEKKEAKTEEREYESDCGTTAVESEQKREKKQKQKKKRPSSGLRSWSPTLLLTTLEPA